jgi:excinuclease UvrABC nuclease subunit
MKKSGVYLIKKNNKVVYVGESHTNNLYKTLYRHFQLWNDKVPQKRVTFKNDRSSGKIKVRVIITTKNQAVRLQKYLIKKYKPSKNELYYNSPEELEKWENQVKRNDKIIDDYFGLPVDNAPF